MPASLNKRLIEVLFKSYFLQLSLRVIPQCLSLITDLIKFISFRLEFGLVLYKYSIKYKSTYFFSNPSSFAIC